MKLFINRSILALRERERERESNLSSVSSLKKSFTLIELSIVLLILSLLVGSLLVGRQIVDRAKIQRIIFEFDYYEKAFHQFYDTYHSLPAHMSRKKCSKFSIFTQNTATSDTPQNMCNAFVDQGAIDGKVLQSWFTQVAFMPMLWVGCAGLIEQIPGNCASGFPGRGFTLENYKPGSGYNRGNAVVTGNTRAVKSSYNHSVSLQYVGFAQKYYMWSYLLYNSVAYPSVNENSNTAYMNNLMNKNTIAMYGAGGKSQRVGTTTETTISRGLNGALSSKIASELDAKIDDGRPGKGKVVASKSNYVVNATSNDEIKKICYDTTFEEVDKAIYTSESDEKYGCNIIKVMEDLK